MTTSNHQLWLEAQIALGKHEQLLGHSLTSTERSAFIRAYIAEYEAANPGKIEA